MDFVYMNTKYSTCSSNGSIGFSAMPSTISSTIRSDEVLPGRVMNMTSLLWARSSTAIDRTLDDLDVMQQI